MPGVAGEGARHTSSCRRRCACVCTGPVGLQPQDHPHTPTARAPHRPHRPTAPAPHAHRHCSRSPAADPGHRGGLQIQVCGCGAHVQAHALLPRQVCRCVPPPPPPPPPQPLFIGGGEHPSNCTVPGRPGCAALQAPAREGCQGRGSACEQRDNCPSLTCRTTFPQWLGGRRRVAQPSCTPTDCDCLTSVVRHDVLVSVSDTMCVLRFNQVWHREYRCTYA